MDLHLHDIVSYQGVDYRVEGLIEYRFNDRALRLARLRGPGQTCFLDLATGDPSDRVLLLTGIDSLDLSTPPPRTIYHRGESYLLKVSGSTQVELTGEGDGRQSGPCALWRYRAAGDQFLQIEQWPDRIRMLAGASVHRSMLEVRPAND